MIDSIIERIDNTKKIILPESTNVKILEAASIISCNNICKIILIGNTEEIELIAKTNNFDISKVEIINPYTYKDIDNLVKYFYELRKDKGVSLNDSYTIIKNNYLYFSAMLLKKGLADGIVCGIETKSSEVLRCALQIIKGTDLISSFFLMDFDNKDKGHNGYLLFSDCALNINPTSEELVKIAKSTEESFRMFFDVDPKIAFLSYSTNSSSTSKDQEKVKYASDIFKEKYNNIIADGEMQLDAAINKEIAKKKYPDSKILGDANILIFPNLDSGNIAYKIAEQFGNAKAFGPITQGLNKPINDLSRGSSLEDIIGTIVITIMQASKIDE